MSRDTPVILEIEHYKCIEVLGRGTATIVYKAKNTLNNELCALKTVLPEKFNKDYLDQLKNEIEVFKYLSHPNIIKLIDSKLELANLNNSSLNYSMPYYTMEMINGITLHDYLIKHAKIDLKDYANILEKLSDAIDYLHTNQIIHCDLKPTNILLKNKTLEPVILDFGLAKFIHKKNEEKKDDFFITPAYVAPEILMNNKITNSSDIYSLGLISYEAITGKKPFKGAKYKDFVQKIIYESPDSIIKYFPNEKLLNTLFLDILSKNINRRPKNAKTFSLKYNEALGIKNYTNDLVDIEKAYIEKKDSFIYTEFLLPAIFLFVPIVILLVSFFNTSRTENIEEKIYVEKEEDLYFDKYNNLKLIKLFNKTKNIEIKLTVLKELKKRKSIELKKLKKNIKNEDSYLLREAYIRAINNLDINFREEVYIFFLDDFDPKVRFSALDELEKNVSLKHIGILKFRLSKESNKKIIKKIKTILLKLSEL